MQQAANGVYELCVYVDSMTHKVEDITEEIAKLRDDIQRMQEDTVTNRLKKSLNEAVDLLENRCNEIKKQLFEIKENIKHKAGQKVANTFRTFADKEEVDYSGQEKRFSKTEVRP